MKKVIILLLFISVVLPLSSISDVTPPTKCRAHCLWDDSQRDCFVDAVGFFCLDMKLPNPYTVWNPCEPCNIITPH